jgi:RimJ/RimL family protein N-acetyltransferase
MICTERLDLAGRAALAAALGAEVPEGWPPEYFDAPALQFTLGRLEAGPGQAGWWLHYVVRREGRVLVGVTGYKGPPAGGAVEIGYSVLPAHQRQGYATEAAAALIARAFAHPEVSRVLAETLPALTPSIGVLEKLGFVLVGEGSAPGVIRYGLERAAPGA